MGNAASCTSYAAGGGSVRVVNGDGEFEEYELGVRAGELMVENPGLFVCDSGYLSVGCRIPGLAADEELERRRLYFLLPMDMLFSVLTEEEMEAISRRASAAMKRRSAAAAAAAAASKRRIFPVLVDFCLIPVEAKQVINEKPAVARSIARPMSRQKSWKPALDTIEEVP